MSANSKAIFSFCFHFFSYYFHLIFSYIFSYFHHIFSMASKNIEASFSSFKGKSFVSILSIPIYFFYVISAWLVLVFFLLKCSILSKQIKLQFNCVQHVVSPAKKWYYTCCYMVAIAISVNFCLFFCFLCFTA